MNGVKVKRLVYSVLGFVFVLWGMMHFVVAVGIGISGFVVLGNGHTSVNGFVGLIFFAIGLLFLSKTRQKKIRGQAALEFLMTYGWAILAALIIVAALLYSNFLKPTTFSPPLATVAAPFEMYGYSIDADLDKISLELGIIGSSDTYEITGVSIDMPSGDSCDYSGETVEINSLTSVVITTSCSGIDLQIGNQFRGDITINYNVKGGSTSLSSTGTISDRIGSASAGEESESSGGVCTDGDGDGWYLESSGCEGESGFIGHDDCEDGDSSIYPGAVELCDGSDNQCSGDAGYGNVDEGCECTPPDSTQSCGSDVGECVAGTETCVDGSWGSCAGETTPVTEVCDGLDNDCDASTDEDSGGSPLTQSCYTGPGGTEGVGICVGGTQTCSGGSYGSCVGDVIPGTEQCGDGLDNDCDGTVDENCAFVGYSVSCGTDCNWCDGNEAAANSGTVDSCTDGTSCDSNTGSCAYMWVNDVEVTSQVSATEFNTGDSVMVTCEIKCWSAGTEWSIVYDDGGGWVVKAYGSCSSSEDYPHTSAPVCSDDFVQVSSTFNLGSNAGTHVVRCQESWQMNLNSDDQMICDDGDSYQDADDVSFSVQGSSAS